MNRLILIIILCLTSGLSQATFELEDPAEIVKEPIEKKENSIFKNWRSEKEVIVSPGTYLYIPDIVNRQCAGWLPDESEPSTAEPNQSQHTTATTYMGTLVSQLECTGNDGNKHFALVRTKEGRMLWVESDKVLSVD